MAISKNGSATHHALVPARPDAKADADRTCLTLDPGRAASAAFRRPATDPLAAVTAIATGLGGEPATEAAIGSLHVRDGAELLESIPIEGDLCAVLQLHEDAQVMRPVVDRRFKNPIRFGRRGVGWARARNTCSCLLRERCSGGCVASSDMPDTGF